MRRRVWSRPWPGTALRVSAATTARRPAQHCITQLELPWTLKAASSFPITIASAKWIWAYLQWQLPPLSLNFGKVKVGRQSKPQRITITNTGTALLEFFSITVSANFLESDTCGSGVEPGATCQISLNFVPAKKGKESGTLTIKPNVAGGSTSITLSGTGVGHAKHPHGS